MPFAEFERLFFLKLDKLLAEMKRQREHGSHELLQGTPVKNPSVTCKIIAR